MTVADSGIVTFMFTDIEGSTRLWETRPEPMRLALARHDVLARRVVDGAGGRIVKGTGDGIYAAFTDPLAAVDAAIGLQLALAEPTSEEALSLRARYGLHAGSAESRDGDFFGTTINRTARLMGVAHGGQVLLSRAVAELLSDRLPPDTTLRDLGGVRLKDFARPERVYQLVHPALRAEFPPLRSLEATPNNLPLQVDAFLGRTQEISELARLLSAQRLVTLFGPGGIGKTRLAQQAGAEMLEAFPDGAWFVDLAPLVDAALVSKAVAQVLGVREDETTHLVDALCAGIGERRMLIILDNCEHLVGACAVLAQALITRLPSLSILATSREHLNVAGEQVYPLAPLAVTGGMQGGLPDAVALFVDRARMKQPDFALTPEAFPVVVELCARLDGIPLALELAAARAGTMPIARMLARLDDRFRLLTGGNRTALPRQQTLHALIDWSFQLLSTDERTLFARLSVFAGGWTAEAAEAVCGHAPLDSGGIEELLAELVRKSLVVADAGGVRYRLLETIRGFAAGVLRNAGETDTLADLHLEHFRALSERAGAHTENSADQPLWMGRLDAEVDNFRVALAHSLAQPVDSDHGLAICASLYRYWAHRGHTHEGYRWCMTTLARRTDGEPDALRTRVINGAGVLAWRQGEVASGRTLSERSLVDARRLGDRGLEARILSNLGGMAVHQADVAAARGYLQATIALEAELGRPVFEARANNNLAALAIAQGDYASAAVTLEISMALCRAHGLRFEESNAASHLGFLAQRRGDFESAAALHARARSIASEFGVREFELEETRQLGVVALARGDLVAARDYLREALAGSRTIGNRYETAECLDTVAGIAQHASAFTSALDAASAAGALRDKLATPRAHADADRHATLRAQCLAALGATTFAAIETRGRSRTPDEAVDAALEWLGPAAGA